jgi:hypothetical protein
MSILDREPLWVRALPYAAGVIAISAGLYLAESHGEEVRDTYWKGVIAEANERHQSDLAKLEADARSDEQAKANALYAADRQLIETQHNEITSRDATIAGLRVGSVSLRDRFACHAAADERVSSAAAGTGQRNAAQAGGLQREDAEFLVRLASDADQVAHQLAACQAVVRADRGDK